MTTSRLAGFAALVGAIIAVAVIVGSLLGGAPSTSAQRCPVGDERSYGTTYVLSISVSDASCRAARKVIRGFHACRPGKRGRCRKTVDGYRCRERRFNRSAISYDSRVSCRRGGRRVRHTYTQFI
jgi:hypothetical protein